MAEQNKPTTPPAAQQPAAAKQPEKAAPAQVAASKEVPPAQPTVTSKNLPPEQPKPSAVEKVLQAALEAKRAGVTPQMLAKLASVDADEHIVAKPLFLPETINVRTKNPNIRVRWVNRNPQRYAQMKYAGFVNATPNDVEVPEEFLADGGKIINGDLILMKIDRLKYDGALKYNRERAVARTSRKAAQAKGQENLKQQIREEAPGAPPELVRKIQVFVPGEAELNGLVGGAE